MNTLTQIKVYADNIRSLLKQIGYSNRYVSIKIKHAKRAVINIQILSSKVNILLVKAIANKFNFINDDVTYIFVDYSYDLKQQLRAKMQPIFTQIDNIYANIGTQTFILVDNSEFCVSFTKSKYIISNKINNRLYDKPIHSSLLLNEHIYDSLYYYKHYTFEELLSSISNLGLIKNYQ